MMLLEVDRHLHIAFLCNLAIPIAAALTLLGPERLLTVLPLNLLPPDNSAQV
jgi:hypothetical protein